MLGCLRKHLLRPGNILPSRTDKSGVAAGGTFSLSLADDRKTLSVIVPGQDKLKRRRCFGEYEQELMTWFRIVEAEVWDWVNAIYKGDGRPKEIFLVTGQTLTTEYSISHIDQRSQSCDVFLEGGADVPTLAGGGLFIGEGLGIKEVAATSGFVSPPKCSGRNEADLHSIFLKVERSKPIILLKEISRKFKSQLRSWLR